MSFFKKFQFNPNPINRDDFRKFVLCTFILFLITSGTIYFLLVNHFISVTLATVLIFLFCFFSTYLLSELICMRVRDIVGDSKISYFNIMMLEYVPITNIPFLAFCFMKKSNSASVFEKRLFQEKKIWLGLCGIMFLMHFSFLFGLGFGHLGKWALTASYWTTNPSMQYITHVAYEAQLVFQMKNNVAGKGDLLLAFSQAQESITFGSTGHILSVAVIASDVNKRKKKFGREPATAKTETMLLLLESLMRQEKLYSEKKDPFRYINPWFVFVSSARMTEAIILFWVDDDIDSRYLEKSKKTYLSMLRNVEEDLKSKGLDKKYESRISALKSQIKAYSTI